jgi:NADH dehydrogenase
MTTFDVVTGAFSYSGAAIASELRTAGRRVRTLTGHPGRAPAGTPIEVRPLDFADPAGLAESLRGAGTLYNTYWVRFAHGQVSHETAVAQSRVLFQAAAEAGVPRVVHVSITHPSADSPYPYFRGKAAVEQALADFRLSHAVLRPAILFGGNGVLINNIAWLLRHLPVFAVGGTGEYRIRPIHVDDLARLAVRAGNSTETSVVDAVGPDRPTFIELASFIKDAVGSRSQVVRVPGSLIPPAARLLGLALRDTLLTAEEYQAMADGLADTQGPATGETSLMQWITDHKGILGRTYANELTRHFRLAGLGAGVRGGVDLAEAVHGDQRVDLGGRDRRVAEQFLDDADVGAAVEHVRGERVAQRVR